MPDIEPTPEWLREQFTWWSNRKSQLEQMDTTRMNAAQLCSHLTVYSTVVNQVSSLGLQLFPNACTEPNARHS